MRARAGPHHISCPVSCDWRRRERAALQQEAHPRCPSCSPALSNRLVAGFLPFTCNPAGGQGNTDGRLAGALREQGSGGAAELRACGSSVHSRRPSPQRPACPTAPRASATCA